MIDIEPHYQVCLDQEDDKMCICDDILQAKVDANIDVQIKEHYE